MVSLCDNITVPLSSFVFPVVDLQHDNQPGRSTCTPSDGNGNYLMFSRATDGTQQNNALFSDCSRESINSNVERVLRLTCFTSK